MAETLIWISGATSGIGQALARTVPYAGARVINLSRTPHPELESVALDLEDRSSWKRVAEHFARELAQFKGRALFIQNAVSIKDVGLMEKTEPAVYADSLTANAVAPIVLGVSFLQALPPGVEGGLLMVSAGGAVKPYPGHSAYNASKAALEQWVRGVRLEIGTRPDSRGKRPWVAAVRPGFVNTPMLQSVAKLDRERYPNVDTMEKARVDGTALPPEFIAKQIWSGLPPKPSAAVLICGAKGLRAFTDDGAEIQ